MPRPVQHAQAERRDEIMEYAALCLRMLHWAWHSDPKSSAWPKERAEAEQAETTTETAPSE